MADHDTSGENRARVQDARRLLDEALAVALGDSSVRAVSVRVPVVDRNGRPRLGRPRQTLERE